jgi:L-rhamnose-H+ transport protein
MGSSSWSFKAIRQLKFEHWLLIGIIVMLFIIPWSTLFAYYPNPLAAFTAVGSPTLLKANLFAFGWGLANVMCVVGFIRIGVALTNGLLAGLGMSVGVTIPMVIKGTGLFKNAPDITSQAGLIVLGGVAVMLIGVTLAALAGFARDKENSGHGTGGRFWTWAALVAVAGVLSSGPAFVFAYSQDPIRNALASQRQGDLPAIFAIYAVGMFAGAMVNIVYCVTLICNNKSWGAFRAGFREIPIPIVTGIQCSVSIVLFAQGSLMLGKMGASVGWGIYQGMQIIGGQLVGFLAGEWKGANPAPRRKMLAAVAVLVAGAAIMAYGNSLV